MRRKAKGSTTYVSGRCPAAPAAGSSRPACSPGTRMYEGRDAYDRAVRRAAPPRAATSTPSCSACEPDGGSLVDPDQVDVWVASWGDWLARLSHEPGLRGAAGRRRDRPGHRAPGSPPRSCPASRRTPRAAARAVMEEVVERYPSASSEMHTYIALTYGPDRRRPSGTRGRHHRPVHAASRPAVRTGRAGGGSAYPLSAERLAEVVRVAYDPAVAPDVLSARAQHGDTGLEWADAGPAAGVETVNAYKHDSGVSRTWMLTLAPRGTVRSSVLRGLLEAAPGTRRKRVALLYRPIDPATSARIVEADRRTAQFMASSGRGLVQARAAPRCGRPSRRRPRRRRARVSWSSR